MNQPWEQGAYDSLFQALFSLTKAIEAYKDGKGKFLSTDSGPLFAMGDHATSAFDELVIALVIAMPATSFPNEVDLDALKEASQCLDLVRGDYVVGAEARAKVADAIRALFGTLIR